MVCSNRSKILTCVRVMPAQNWWYQSIQWSQRIWDPLKYSPLSVQKQSFSIWGFIRFEACLLFPTLLSLSRQWRPFPFVRFGVDPGGSDIFCVAGVIAFKIRVFGSSSSKVRVFVVGLSFCSAGLIMEILRDSRRWNSLYFCIFISRIYWDIMVQAKF